MPQTCLPLLSNPWDIIKIAFEKIHQKDIASGVMKKDAVIISNKWFPAAHLDYYLAMPLHMDLLALGPINDIHQYAYLNDTRKKLQTGDDAYVIIPSENIFNVYKYKSLFEKFSGPEIMEQKRNGKTNRLIYIFRLNNFLGNSNLLNQ